MILAENSLTMLLARSFTDGVSCYYIRDYYTDYLCWARRHYTNSSFAIKIRKRNHEEYTSILGSTK